MAADVATWSRRAVIAGLAGLAASATARSQTEARSGAPPVLQTGTSQFIELQPAVGPPALIFERIDGRLVDLAAFRGKAVLVSFWASWCPICRRELPLLERLQQIVGPRSLEIVAMSVDMADRAAIEAFMGRLNVTKLRPYLDPTGQVVKRPGDRAPTPFVLYGMPISYVVDYRGRIAGYITGEVNWPSVSGLNLLKYYSSA